MKTNKTNRSLPIARLLCALLVVTVCLGALLITAPHAQAAGEMMSTAVDAVFGQTYYKGWTSGSDHLNHYVKFVIPQRGMVSIRATKPYDSEGEYGDLVFAIYDADGNGLWKVDSYYSKDNARDHYINHVGLEAGTYYLTIQPDFYVRSGVISTNYCIDFAPNQYCEVESNDDAASATALEFGHMYAGYFGCDGASHEYSSNDYFKFPVKAGQTYRITMENYGVIDGTTIIDKMILPVTGNTYARFQYIDNDANHYAEFKAENSGTAYFYMYNYIKEQIKYGIRVDNATCLSKGHKYSGNTCTRCGVKLVTIDSQPSTVKIAAGKTAKFTVSATGSGLKYQWQYRKNSASAWKNASATGSKTNTLQVPATVSKSAFQYRCRITTSNGKVVYTKTASLYVLGIKTQPVTAKLVDGKVATFKVTATGHGKTYQWQYRENSSASWKNVTSAGNKTAAVKVRARVKNSAYQYRCVITDSAGNTVNSKVVSLYTLGIKTQPVNVTAAVRETAVFKAAATGHGKLYQWQFRTSADGNWKNASAAGNKTATLSIPATAAKDGFKYRLRITDSAGNVIYSKVVTLNVE